MREAIGLIMKNLEYPLENWDIHPERLLETILLGMSIEELVDIFYNVCPYECDNHNCLANITIGFALLNLPDVCRTPGCNQPCAEDRYGSKFIYCEKHMEGRHQRFLDWLDRKCMELCGDLEKWK